MSKLRACIAGFVAALFLVPSLALAKNFCVSGFPNSSYILVGIGFKVPAKGACKAFNGFNAETGGGVASSGIGCTSSDGTTLTLSVTSGSEEFGFAEIDTVSLSLPSLTGTVIGQAIFNSAVSTFGPSTGINGAACTTKVIPALVGGPPSARSGDGISVVR